MEGGVFIVSFDFLVKWWVLGGRLLVLLFASYFFICVSKVVGADPHAASFSLYG